jgi:hypothetical protein
MGTSGEIEGVRDQAHEFIDQKLNNVASSSESGENEQPRGKPKAMLSANIGKGSA